MGLLWGSSWALILISFLIFDRVNTMTLAAMENISYLSVMICFVMFLINDLYGFASVSPPDQYSEPNFSKESLYFVVSEW